jgi:hypothetical protein
VVVGDVEVVVGDVVVVVSDVVVLLLLLLLELVDVDEAVDVVVGLKRKQTMSTKET